MTKINKFWLGSLFFVLAFSIGIVILNINKVEEDNIIEASAVRIGNENNIRSSNLTYNNKLSWRTNVSSSEDNIGVVATNQLKYPIYITGAIKRPGIYHISEDKYLYEVIEMAGGFTSDAAKFLLNLASKVEPESHIIIYSEDESKELNLDKNDITNQINYYNINTHNNGLININKASKDELLTLPGIGNNLATKIIEYRNVVGSFTKVEQLMEVPGIKENKYNNLKALIRV